jgi:hypothetical protein
MARRRRAQGETSPPVTVGQPGGRQEERAALARLPDDPEPVDPDPLPPPDITSVAVSLTVGTGDGPVVVGDGLGAATSGVSSMSRPVTSSSSTVKVRVVWPTEGESAT